MKSQIEHRTWGENEVAKQGSSDTQEQRVTEPQGGGGALSRWPSGNSQAWGTDSERMRTLTIKLGISPKKKRIRTQEEDHGSTAAGGEPQCWL